jgi:hypothetical protein
MAKGYRLAMAGQLGTKVEMPQSASNWRSSFVSEADVDLPQGDAGARIEGEHATSGRAEVGALEQLRVAQHLSANGVHATVLLKSR